MYVVTKIGVSGEVPRHGWWTIHVAAGDHVKIDASHAFDPVPDLLCWLETIARGSPARVAVDEEGSEVVLVATPAGDDAVSLQIFRESADTPATPIIDTRVQARLLVAEFYACVQALGNDQRSFNAGWVVSHPESVMLPPFRSPTIEAYLGG